MGPFERWKATVGVAIALQWMAVLALAGVTWLVFSPAAARSLLFGGAAVALPNTVLASWLSLRVRKTGSVGAAAMMLGEILKLAMTIALLVAVVIRLQAEVAWLGLIVGVVAALKAQWVSLWVTRRY